MYTNYRTARWLFINLIVCLIISSCKNKDQELLGTWYEVTDSNRAGIIIFETDSVRSPYDWFGGHNISYTLTGNKITYDFYNWELKYSIENDTLLITNDKDFKIYKFHKRGPFDIHDFVAYRYGVELTEIESAPIYSWNDDDNIIVLKLTEDSLIDLKINGISYELNSGLYTKIMMKKSPNVIENYLFADKNLSVGHLKLLESQLFRAKYYEIDYVTYYRGSLNSISTRLPRVEFDYPDSMLDKIPPTLPPYKFDYGKDILCEISKDELRLNNQIITLDSLKAKIHADFSLGKKPMLAVSFDQNMRYEDYLRAFNNIRKIYYDLWDNYVYQTFGMSEYTKTYYSMAGSIDGEIKLAVYNNCPMNIVELLDKEQLKFIKQKISSL